MEQLNHHCLSKFKTLKILVKRRYKCKQVPKSLDAPQIYKECLQRINTVTLTFELAATDFHFRSFFNQSKHINVMEGTRNF